MRMETATSFAPAFAVGIGWQARCDGPPPNAQNSDAALKYLSRYVMGSALRDGRVISDDGRDVVIRIKDYRVQQVRPLKLSAEEFVERYLLHILPKGFRRVRHAGLFAGSKREASLALCRQLLATADATEHQRSGPGMRGAAKEEPELDAAAVVAEVEQELAEAEEAEPEAWTRRCPRCRLPMEPLGALSAQATSLLLEQVRAMWLRVTTFLVVAAKRPVASSTPLFDQPIPWSLLGWSITTCDAAVQAQRSSTQTDFLPVPDT